MGSRRVLRIRGGPIQLWIVDVLRTTQGFTSEKVGCNNPMHDLVDLCRLGTVANALTGAAVSVAMLTRGTKYLRQIDSRTVIPLTDGKPSPSIGAGRLIVGEFDKAGSTSDQVIKQPSQLTASAIELRTSA